MQHIQRRRRVLVLVVLFVAALGATIYSSVHASDVPPGVSTHGILATDVLSKLAARPKMSRKGYDRTKFADGWQEISGCDMRNRILRRDLASPVISSPDGCIVLSGTLQHDAYSGKTVPFTRGAGTSQAIQIDHIVAVADAWQKGAQQWTPQKRNSFYNDPLNLLAVEGSANSQKSDSDAAAWLPPNKEYRCRYVARQVAVKIKYGLWVTNDERAAMQRVLFYCPKQILPQGPDD